MSFLHGPGDLATTPLAAVLLEALNLRASGVLSVEHGGGTSRLWFRDGRPVGAQVFSGFRPLGHLLLQAGLIDIDALSRSLAAMAAEGRPQGQILVSMGVVSRADVDRVLAEQQAGYFALIAALDGGGFGFDPGATVPEWTKGSLLSPLRTIVDALERPQAGALVVSALQPVAAVGVRLSSGYGAVAEAFRWTATERVLVARLERPQGLEAFFARSDVSPERARAILAALLLLGLAVPPSRSPGSETPAPTSTRDDLQPPPAGPSGGTPLPAPARRSDPAEARARRQRLLQQAMRNMGVGPFGGSRTPPPTTPRPSFDPLATPVPTPVATAVGPAERALRDALLAAAPRATERDYFARLGIAPTAGREEVKKAFLAIARQFHPDRFASPAFADLAGTVKDFFTAVNEAYEVLSDDRRRAEYLGRHQSAAQAQAGAARIDFQKGEACLRTRDWGRARAFYESALRADPRAEYQAALAFVLNADPQHRDRARAHALLEEATKDRACDRAFWAAGVLARDEGDDVNAERMFRIAVQANPRNAEAVRELRQCESRRAERRGR